MKINVTKNIQYRMYQGIPVGNVLDIVSYIESQGGGGTPSQYLKTISIDETAKTVTITDKDDVTFTFPYSKTLTAGELINISNDVIKVVNTKTLTTTSSDNEVPTAKAVVNYAVAKMDAQTQNPFLYGRMNVEEGGTEGKFTCSKSLLSGGCIPIRQANGNLLVPDEPNLDGHATSKKYVDEKVKLYLHTIRCKNSLNNITFNIITNTSAVMTENQVGQWLTTKGFNDQNSLYQASGIYNEGYYCLIAGIYWNASETSIYLSALGSEVLIRAIGTVAAYTVTDTVVELN